MEERRQGKPMGLEGHPLLSRILIMVTRAPFPDAPAPWIRLDVTKGTGEAGLGWPQCANQSGSAS
jgi:hypothetical protein